MDHIEKLAYQLDSLKKFYSEEDIAQICYIPTGATRIKDKISVAIKQIDEDNYSPKRLIEELEDMEKNAPNSKERGIIRSTIIRVRQLLRYQVFGNNDIPIEDIMSSRSDPWNFSTEYIEFFSKLINSK